MLLLHLINILIKFLNIYSSLYRINSYIIRLLPCSFSCLLRKIFFFITCVINHSERTPLQNRTDHSARFSAYSDVQPVLRFFVITRAAAAPRHSSTCSMKHTDLFIPGNIVLFSILQYPFIPISGSESPHHMHCPLPGTTDMVHAVPFLLRVQYSSRQESSSPPPLAAVVSAQLTAQKRVPIGIIRWGLAAAYSVIPQITGPSYIPEPSAQPS